jgi:DNA-binding MarR family transcriptional regulator
MEATLPIVDHSVETRLLAGLSKIALILRHQGWSEAGEHGLTPTQSQILTLLWSRRPTALGVSEVAEELALTKPTVSDSVSALVRKELLQKERSPRDARAVDLRLTPRGEDIAAGSAGWPEFLTSAVRSLSPREQAIFLRGLVKMVHSLQEQGYVPVSRMCVNCSSFQPSRDSQSETPHFCEALNTSMPDHALRLDCGEFTVAPNEQRIHTWNTFAGEAFP